MTPTRFVPTAILLVALAVSAVACGGSARPSPTPSPSPSAPPPQAGRSEEPVGFTSVYFVDAQTGWVAGYLGGDNGGAILGTTDGGRTWRRQYADTRVIGGLQFISPLIGWAVAWPHRGSWDEESTILLHTTDGGQNWQPVGELSGLLSYQFISPTLGRAVVGPLHFAGSGDLAETVDGGRTWMTLDTPSELHSACFVDADHGWATSAEEVLRTSDGGRSWATVFTVPSDLLPADPTGVRCRDRDVAWVFLFGGVASSNVTYALYRTVDDGAHWEPVLAHQYPQLDVPDRGPQPGPFSLVDRFTAYFVTNCPPCANGNAYIQGTGDAGKSWGASVVIPDLSEPSAIAFPDADRGWAVGAQFTGNGTTKQAVILTTKDRGQTWTKQYPWRPPVTPPAGGNPSP